MNMDTDEVFIEDEHKSSVPDLQLMLEALLGSGLAAGGNSGSMLDAFLAQANLMPQQQSIIKLLMAMSNKPDAGEGEGEGEGEEGLDVNFNANDDEFNVAVDPSEPLSQELSDLRCVNDTAAEALGACPICWGGDTSCQQCLGQGTAGHRMPNSGLFNQLVIPAVKRMRSITRATSRHNS